jgi:hypothetical protein
MKKIFLSATLIIVCCAVLSGQDKTPFRQHTNYPSGCTVITISKGDSVFFGGNDDYINPDSYYFVEKGDSSRYGVIWIGTPDNPQQGINEKGLAYDSNGLPRVNVNPHTERIPVMGEYYHNYIMQIMHECSTVEEVIAWINIHQRFPYMHDQLHFADKTGDAVIVSAGKDGEMVFTRKKPGDGFLVSTNFNVANPSPGANYPCWRFDLANELLTKLIDKPEPINYGDLTDVMDAVHTEGASWTIETLVADLTEGIMYIYYFYQYDKPVIINVKDELTYSREASPLSELFPDEVRQEALKRYNDVTRSARVNKIAGISWPAAVILSLIIFLVLPDRKKGLKFWLPAIIVLGPAGLLAKILVLKSVNKPIRQNAIIETTGNITPLIIIFLVSQVFIILKAVNGSISQQQQAMLIFILPLLASWIIFHGPVLALANKKNYIRFLFRRLPQVLVTTFLGLAGILPVAMPLENMTLAMSQIIPLSPWIVMAWWAIIVLGSLAGGLLVFIYEHWAVKRGYQAWSIIAGNEGEVNTPGWSNIWWWTLVSIIITVTLFAVTIMLLNIITG